MRENHYIYKSLQKIGIPGMPVCLEHTGILSQLLRKEKESKDDLTVLLLDLAYAYGSMLHKLVSKVLKTHHVPQTVSELIRNFYTNLQVRMLSKTFLEWHTLEKGTITGCTMSAVLFLLAMNMLMKIAEVECRGPLSNLGVRQHSIITNMNDNSRNNISYGRQMDIEWLRGKRRIGWN